ncbi:LAETG motif-containing sortase-dependent surface protein, partial [Streptomyces carpinensis]
RGAHPRRGAEGGLTTQTVSEPSPATAGGISGGTDLAQTGGTDSTPLIAAIGLSLLVLGGTALSIVHKNKASRN